MSGGTCLQDAQSFKILAKSLSVMFDCNIYLFSVTGEMNSFEAVD